MPKYRQRDPVATLNENPSKKWTPSIPKLECNLFGAKHGKNLKQCSRMETLKRLPSYHEA